MIAARPLPAASVSVSEAYNDHQTWCSIEGRVPFLKPRKFSAAVIEVRPGCTVGRSEKGNVPSQGIKLASPSPRKRSDVASIAMSGASCFAALLVVLRAGARSWL